MPAWFGPGSGPNTSGYQPQPLQIARANNPFPGHSDYQFPTEDPGSYLQRMTSQYNMRGGNPLPREWESQLPGGGGMYGNAPNTSPFLFPGPLPQQGVRTPDGLLVSGTVLPNGQVQGQVTLPNGQVQQGIFPVGGNGRTLDMAGMQGDDKLEQQRQLAFGALGSQRDFYNTDATALSTERALQAQLAGMDQPFGMNVQNAMYADNADASAGQVASQSDMIRRAMSGAGLGGSGLEASALMDSRSRVGKATRRGRRDIKSRAQLENYQARERARDASAQYTAQKAANRADAIRQEVGLRSRFEVTGESPYAQEGGGAGGTDAKAGENPYAKVRSTGGVLGDGSFTGGMGFNLRGQQAKDGSWSGGLRGQRQFQRDPNDPSGQGANASATYGSPPSIYGDRAVGGRNRNTRVPMPTPTDAWPPPALPPWGLPSNATSPPPVGMQRVGGWSSAGGLGGNGGQVQGSGGLGGSGGSAWSANGINLLSGAPQQSQASQAANRLAINLGLGENVGHTYNSSYDRFNYGTGSTALG